MRLRFGVVGVPVWSNELPLIVGVFVRRSAHVSVGQRGRRCPSSYFVVIELFFMIALAFFLWPKINKDGNICVSFLFNVKFKFLKIITLISRLRNLYRTKWLHIYPIILPNHVYPLHCLINHLADWPVGQRYKILTLICL